MKYVNHKLDFLMEYKFLIIKHSKRISDIYGILKVRTQLPRVKELAVKFN